MSRSRGAFLSDDAVDVIDIEGRPAIIVPVHIDFAVEYTIPPIGAMADICDAIEKHGSCTEIVFSGWGAGGNGSRWICGGLDQLRKREV